MASAFQLLVDVAVKGERKLAEKPVGLICETGAWELFVELGPRMPGGRAFPSRPREEPGREPLLRAGPRPPPGVLGLGSSRSFVVPTPVCSSCFRLCLRLMLLVCLTYAELTSARPPWCWVPRAVGWVAGSRPPGHLRIAVRAAGVRSSCRFWPRGLGGVPGSAGGGEGSHSWRCGSVVILDSFFSGLLSVTSGRPASVWVSVCSWRGVVGCRLTVVHGEVPPPPRCQGLAGDVVHGPGARERHAGFQAPSGCLESEPPAL